MRGTERKLKNKKQGVGLGTRLYKGSMENVKNLYGVELNSVRQFLF